MHKTTYAKYPSQGLTWKALPTLLKSYMQPHTLAPLKSLALQRNKSCNKN